MNSATMTTTFSERVGLQVVSTIETTKQGNITNSSRSMDNEDLSTNSTMIAFYISISILCIIFSLSLVFFLLMRLIRRNNTSSYVPPSASPSVEMINISTQDTPL
jgi:hypothetical protein